MGAQRGRVTKDGAHTLLVFVRDLDVQLTRPSPHDTVFSLAESHGLTVYDATYLDLAIREGGTAGELGYGPPSL